MTHFYRAYGLSIASNRVIPGLHPISDPCFPDLTIEIDCQSPAWVETARRLPASVLDSAPPTPETADPSYTLNVLGNDDFFELIYGDGVQVVISGSGERLWAMYSAPLTMDDLAVYLRGPVSGFVLRRRGVTALHASAIGFDTGAVVMCGQSESGKSTTAAALSLAGKAVLCEDIAALREQAGKFHIEPGYPRICLWPDAVQDLFGSPDALPRLTPAWDKRFLPLDGARAKFETERRPIQAIYLLASRAEGPDAPRVEQMNRSDALLELVQNTYMNWLLNGKQRATEFDLLSRLVTQVPVRRILPHKDATRIGRLRDLIISDAGNLIFDQDSSLLASRL